MHTTCEAPAEQDDNYKINISTNRTEAVYQRQHLQTKDSSTNTSNNPDNMINDLKPTINKHNRPP